MAVPAVLLPILACSRGRTLHGAVQQDTREQHPRHRKYGRCYVVYTRLPRGLKRVSPVRPCHAVLRRAGSGRPAPKPVWAGAHEWLRRTCPLDKISALRVFADAPRLLRQHTSQAGRSSCINDVIRAYMVDGVVRLVLLLLGLHPGLTYTATNSFQAATTRFVRWMTTSSSGRESTLR